MSAVLNERNHNLPPHAEFDGTLLGSDGTIAQRDLYALETLSRRANQDNTDFESRIERHFEFGQPLDDIHLSGFDEASQFIAVVPPEKSRDALEAVRNGLPGLKRCLRIMMVVWLRRLLAGLRQSFKPIADFRHQML